MQKDQQKLEQLIKGKKVAFIGAGVSHKTLIREFVELGAHVTLCDQKKSVEDFGDYAATIKELGIDLSLGENYLDGFKGQDIIMRISLVVWPVSASKDLTSWGFSSEGMHLSMRAIRSIPPKKAMTVLQLPHFSPSSAWSASWAWEKISIMET